MKRFDLLKILLVALVVTVATTGCRSRTKNLTPIPGSKGPTDDGGIKPPYTPSTAIYTPPPVRPPPQPPSYPPTDTGNNFPPQPKPTGIDLIPGTTDRTPTGISAGSREEFDRMIKDAGLFKNNTVYFDFDSSVIKDKERTKIEAVAAYLKTQPTNKLLVEGYCDERGTEEYNRALGERRALAVREYLVRLGVQGSRIRTKSLGSDLPADSGHNETAWSKNRRGVFIVLTPR